MAATAMAARRTASVAVVAAKAVGEMEERRAIGAIGETDEHLVKMLAVAIILFS